MNFYIEVAAKLIIGLLFITLLINVTGKGNLAPTSPTDQLQNYVLGGIIGGVIYSSTITMAQYIVILLIWASLILITRYAKTHIHAVGKYIDGEPVTIVKDGQLLVKNCLKVHLTAKEVDFKLRTGGVSDIHDVQRAIVEQNGSLTILHKGDKDVRYPVIVDGRTNPDVLELMDRDEEWLEGKLKEQGVKRVSDVFLAKYQDQKLDVVTYSGR
ncbi:membrane protein [Bifidobacterium actinocoloniiforme DSM 22766]|nr:membrane protein [Bifidobacterium actinocoloniiforme DSM 22766]